MPAVLFVCLGNICRSPTAEGLFRAHVAAAGLSSGFSFDSAGTGDWHLGEPPDPRAIATAARRGVDISDLRARQVIPADFERFDLILGMDQQNIANLKRLAPAGAAQRVSLFLEAAQGLSAEVPDPYTHDQRMFDHVFDLCNEAAAALVQKLQAASG